MNFKKYWMMLAIALIGLCTVNCGGDESNESDKNSTITANDPEGTIITNLTHNSSFYLSGTQILIQMWSDTNFGFSYGPKVAIVGKVKGISSITKVPENGWTDQVAAIPEYGYVVKSGNTYVRLYVVDYIVNSSNDIKGCVLKYQVWNPVVE